MGEFPSGQRGQTVNLLAMPSVVRIHLPPPSTAERQCLFYDLNRSDRQEVRKLTIQGGYRKYGEISFLRGVAITTIVLMHLIQVYWNGGEIPMWLRFAASLGGTGGHVFIFCSGFGLYLSYLHRPQRFGGFLKKRFVKIYIPYLIFMIIAFFLPHGTVDEWARFRALLSHVFLYKMFFEKYVCSFGLQLWFISTIIQLYLLFIPLCRLREKTSARTLLILSAAISAVWWVAMYLTGLQEKRIWGSFCLQYLWEFVFGMMAAEYMFRHDRIRIPVWSLLLLTVCGLGLQAVTARLGGIFAACNDIPALFGYGSAVLLLCRFGKHLLRPAFLWIDGISFEWFLVHVDAIMWAYHFARQMTEIELIRALIATAFSLAAAWIFSRLVRLVMRRLPLGDSK